MVLIDYSSKTPSGVQELWVIKKYGHFKGMIEITKDYWLNKSTAFSGHPTDRANFYKYLRAVWKKPGKDKTHPQRTKLVNIHLKEFFNNNEYDVEDSKFLINGHTEITSIIFEYLETNGE